jgi:hypothetical protein
MENVPKNTRYLALTFLDNTQDAEEIFLNRFPLIIKGNKLIPCGNKQQIEKFWINNGFYFPIMKKAKRNRVFETIPLWSLGLRGLPYLKIY